ncbi:hypothetical protein C8R43DRAFT_1115590 [Mycena crocata]|nr:hypothetical protein C8R43DRAFT_1115590 [Mycena crocata]
MSRLCFYNFYLSTYSSDVLERCDDNAMQSHHWTNATRAPKRCFFVANAPFRSTETLLEAARRRCLPTFYEDTLLGSDGRWRDVSSTLRVGFCAQTQTQEAVQNGHIRDQTMTKEHLLKSADNEQDVASVGRGFRHFVQCPQDRDFWQITKSSNSSYNAVDNPPTTASGIPTKCASCVCVCAQKPTLSAPNQPRVFTHTKLHGGHKSLESPGRTGGGGMDQ